MNHLTAEEIERGRRLIREGPPPEPEPLWRTEGIEDLRANAAAALASLTGDDAWTRKILARFIEDATEAGQ